MTTPDPKDKDFLDERVKLLNAAVCRACHNHISFKRLANGKSIAVEDDGNLHRCSEWGSWRADQG